MKIFNRGSEPKPAGPAAATAVTAPPAKEKEKEKPAQAPAPKDQAAAPAAQAAPAPAGAAAPAPANPPATAAAPDLAVILDANVKEMSEKIARLASTLETAQQERTGFEAKIEQMDERMRKLSSLTEMISAQYNPFVGDAPSERGEMPRPEVGLAPPTMAMGALPPPPAPAAASAGAPPGLSLPLDSGPMPAQPDFSTLPPFEGEPAEAAAPPLLPSLDPIAAPPSLPQVAAPAPEVARERELPTTASAPEPVEAAEPGVYLWSCPPGFESSMVLLGWADMLLKNSGSRESLLELVNYYHNIGWVGDPARDQLLAYADGLTAPPEGETKDWRANVDVHERSLLFVEKLRAIARRKG